MIDLIDVKPHISHMIFQSTNLQLSAGSKSFHATSQRRVVLRAYIFSGLIKNQIRSSATEFEGSAANPMSTVGQPSQEERHLGEIYSSEFEVTRGRTCVTQ